MKIAYTILVMVFITEIILLNIFSSLAESSIQRVLVNSIWAISIAHTGYLLRKLSETERRN